MARSATAIRTCPCGRVAVRGGLCGACYSRQYRRQQYGMRWPVRVRTTCLVCGVEILVVPGVRYCRRHKGRRSLVPAPVVLHRLEQPEFPELSASDVVKQAAATIRILRPDGTVDQERTRLAREEWLARKRQELRGLR